MQLYLLRQVTLVELQVRRVNLGSGYSRPPVVTSDSNIILTDIEGTFLLGEPLTSQPYRQLKEDLGAIKLETVIF